MALDATIAGSSANSYLDVASADALARTDLGPNAKAWLDALAEDKEAALIRATEDIDGTVGRVGSYTVLGQRLLFPRFDDVDPITGVSIIPRNLQRATYLQASYVLRNAGVLDDAASFRARGLSNFSNPDGVSGQVADDPRWGVLHPRVDRMLDEFTSGAIIATIIPT